MESWIDKVWIEAIIIDGLVENGFISADDVDSAGEIGVNVSATISYGSHADGQHGTDIEDAAYMAAYGDAVVVWKYCPWTGQDVILF